MQAAYAGRFSGSIELQLISAHLPD